MKRGCGKQKGGAREGEGGMEENGAHSSTADDRRENDHEEKGGIFASIDEVRVDISGVIVVSHTLGKSPPCR